MPGADMMVGLHGDADPFANRPRGVASLADATSFFAIYFQAPVRRQNYQQGSARIADDKTQRGPQDSSRVNIHENYEVEHWTGKWGVTRAQLEAAVKKVGVSAAAVAEELGK